jgi:hypothetical protein
LKLQETFLHHRTFLCVKNTHFFSNPLLVEFLIHADKTTFCNIILANLPNSILWNCSLPPPYCRHWILSILLVFSNLVK